MASGRDSADAVIESADARNVRKRIAKQTVGQPDDGDPSDLRTHPGRPVASVGNVELPDAPLSEVDMPPEEVARRAFNHGALMDPSTRQTALDEITKQTPLGATATGQALAQVLENADRAVDILSLVGYNQLRHLRANGLSVARIAKDLGLNINDLTAFMSQAPTANEDAMIDEEAYADVKASELLEVLETIKPKSNLDTDVLKIRMGFLLEYNKRLSHKWAQKPDEDIAARLPTLNINLGVVAPTPRMIQQERDQASVTTPTPVSHLEESGDLSIAAEVIVADQLDDELPIVRPIMVLADDDTGE